MAENPDFPRHIISEGEFKSRNNMIIFSNVGLHLREGLKEEKKLDEFLEKVRKDEKSSSRQSNSIKLPELSKI